MIQRLPYASTRSSDAITVSLAIRATALLNCWTMYTPSTHPFGVVEVVRGSTYTLRSHPSQRCAYVDHPRQLAQA
jgi:hypothetical protein